MSNDVDGTGSLLLFFRPERIGLILHLIELTIIFDADSRHFPTKNMHDEIAVIPL